MICRNLELPGWKREVMEGWDTAGTGLFFAWPALKTRSLGPILRRAKPLLSLGWWVCVWGMHPVRRSKSRCWRCSSSSQVFPLPHCKEGSFSPACPGKALNCPTLIANWELELCPRPPSGCTTALSLSFIPSVCPSLVTDAQLWFESLSAAKKMNRKGETDTLIKGTA